MFDYNFYIPKTLNNLKLRDKLAIYVRIFLLKAAFTVFMFYMVCSLGLLISKLLMGENLSIPELLAFIIAVGVFWYSSLKYVLTECGVGATFIGLYDKCINKRSSRPKQGNAD